MTGNSQPTEKLRALFLAALMVFSVFAGAVAFSGTAAAANAGNAASVTAEAIDTTDSSTSNITVVQEDNTDTATGDVEIAIYDADGELIDTFDSSQTGSANGLESVATDGNETTFEINSDELANNYDFQLGEGSVQADADDGGSPDATTNPDATTSVDLQGLVVTSATSESRVAANDTEIDYTLNLENTGSSSVTQDIQLVSSGANNSLDATNFTTEDFTEVASNGSVTVDAEATYSETFTINTGDLPGANDNVNTYDIAGYTLASTGTTPFGAGVVNAGSPAGNSLVTGSGTEGSVTISVVDDTSERQEGVDVELWLEGDFDDENLVIREGTTNENGEVTFGGLAVGADDNNDIRYTARAGANTPDLSSTSTTLSLYEPTQTSDSSTVVTDRVRQPERIEVEPDSDSAIADGSDTITYTATVFGGIDGEPDSGDDQPFEDAEVEVTASGDSLIIGGTTPDSISGDTRTYTTDSNGQFTYTVSSGVVQTAEFEFDATADNTDALDETVTGTFVLNGEGSFAGTVNNEATTNPIPDASAWIVSENDYTTNEITTSVDISPGAFNEADSTLWIRLVDNETNEIINNDEYDLRAAEGNSNDGTHVRKIDELNESDAAVGQGYALIDADGDDMIQFNHTRLLNENYYAQVSFNAENSSAGTDVIDVGTEDFVNVTSVTGADNEVDALGGNDQIVFEPTANLTLGATEDLSNLTDANYVDSPDFVNSYGFDTEGTTDNGRFVLNQLPTDLQSGQQYVAIATKTGFTTDFADVYVQEDGQYSFTEGQGSNEFFLEPVEVDPDGVDIQQQGIRANMSASLQPFTDKSDSTYQNVSRDGEAVDVFTVNTTAEGTLVNATTTVSIVDTSVAGEFVNIAGGEFVSIDNSTNTATLYTGSDGQAEIWYQADSASSTVDTEKTAVLDADSSVTGSSNVRFVGVLETSAAEVSGIVTDSNNDPVPSVVYTSEFTVAGNGFTLEPVAADMSEFRLTRTGGDSAVINRSQAENYNFQENITGAPAFPGVSIAPYLSDVTLVTDSTAGVQESSSYTLPRVPSEGNPLVGQNDVTVKATSDGSIANANSVSDFENGTAVTTATEINRTSTANVEISGAEAGTFSVNSVTASPNPAEQGDNVTVEVEVENVGSVTSNTDVTLSIGTDVANATEQDTVQSAVLAPGNTDTVTFTVDTSSLDAGDYVHVVEASASQPAGTAPQTITNSSSPGANWYDGYVDNNDVVDDGGINDAVADYLDDDLSDSRFNAVVASYLDETAIDTSA